MKDFYFPNMPKTLTDFFLAVAEEVLVQGLVPVLVVELGGVRGHGGHVLDVTDCPPVELLGSHPGLPAHISSPSSLFSSRGSHNAFSDSLKCNYA